MLQWNLDTFVSVLTPDGGSDPLAVVPLMLVSRGSKSFMIKVALVITLGI